MVNTYMYFFFYGKELIPKKSNQPNLLLRQEFPRTITGRRNGISERFFEDNSMDDVI